MRPMSHDYAACRARQIAGDADADRLGHKAVLAQLKTHDEVTEDLRPIWGLMKAAEQTEYWNYVDDNDRTTTDDKNGHNLGWLYDGRIEVNRIKPAMTQFISALYPRRMEAVVERDVATTGDETAAQLILNKMMRAERSRDRIKMVARQAIMFGGPGLKAGYDCDGDGNVLDRVWTVAIPAWELVLDRDARDWAQARFYGHAYYAPKHEIERDYGLEGLVGTTRDDFLGTRIEDSSKSERDRNTEKQSGGKKDDDYVRVLELCNMVDSWSIGDEKCKGRFEVWVLGQGERSTCPVFMGPMPVTHVDGRPMSNILPCLLDHEIDFPLRGASAIKAMMPQQAELNAQRTHEVQMGRQDVATYMMPEGMFDAKQLQKLRRGIVGQVMTYKDGMAGEGGVTDPERAFVQVKRANVSTNNKMAGQAAEQDLSRAIPASPGSVGVVTKATAEEVRAVEAHTESMFGEIAEQRDVWLTSWLKLLLRIIVCAMRDTGKVEEEVEDESDDASVEAEDYGVEIKPEMPEVDENEAPPLPEEPAEVEPSTDKTITLRVNGEEVVITADDLDSDFDIGLSEAGRTPMGDAQRRQDLVSMMQPAQALVQVAAEGSGVDPKAALSEWAKRWYNELHLASSWPKSLDLAVIFDAVTKQAPAKPPPMPEGPPQQPQQQAPDLSQMPPADALAVLAEALQEEHPEAAAAAQEALAGPPEGHAAAVEQLLQYVQSVQ